MDLGIVSLTLGNSCLPFAHRLVGDVEPVGQLPLGQPPLFSQLGHKGPELDVVQEDRSFLFPVIIGETREKGNLRKVEWARRGERE